MSLRLAAVVLVVGVAFIVSPARADGDLSSPRGEVRALNADLQRALTIGLDRSETLRAVVQEIERRDGIVLLESTNRLALTRAGILGATSHDVVVVGARRLVRVTILPGSDIRTIATIAHELEHSLEILASAARNREEVVALYQRIGEAAADSPRVGRGPARFETAAAREIGDRVRRELEAQSATVVAHGARPSR